MLGHKQPEYYSNFMQFDFWKYFYILIEMFDINLWTIIYLILIYVILIYEP